MFEATKADNNVVSAREVLFDEETPLPVGRETRDVLCIANAGVKMVKLLMLWTQSERFDVTFSPKVLVFRKGYAGEMHISITPRCSGDQTTTMTLSYVDFHTVKTVMKCVGIDFETETTTMLHYDDVVC